MLKLPAPLNQAITKAAVRFQRRTKEFTATLCNANADTTPGLDASVSTTSGFVYAVMPDGSVVKAYNGRVPATTGLRVWIGYEPRNPALLRVLDFNYSYPIPGPLTGIGPHHVTHEWLNAAGGNDAVFSQARQLMPLRVSPAGALTIKIEAGPEWTPAGWTDSPSGTLDLSSYTPVTGALYVLIYLDSAGALQSRAGSNIGPFGTLTNADIPALGQNELALAAVAIYAGQTAIQETRAVQDVVDLRFVQANTGTVSPLTTKGDLWGHDTADNRVPVGSNGKVLTADSTQALGVKWAASTASTLGLFNVVDYGAVAGGTAAANTTAIQAAFDAAHVAGGIVWFPPGTYLTNALTFYRNIAIQGSGQTTTVLQMNSAADLLTCTGGTPSGYLFIRDIDLEGNSIGHTAINFNDGSHLIIENVFIRSFTVTHMILAGIFLSQFINLVMDDGGIGCDLKEHGIYDPDSLNFINCTLDDFTSFAIKWVKGCQLNLINCDLESNGTTGNAGTAAIYVKANNQTTPLGISIINTRFERNKGLANVWLDTPAVAATVTHSIQDCVSHVNANLSYGVYVNGGTHPQTVQIRNYQIDSVAASPVGVADFFATGSGAIIELNRCTGTTSTASGGTITTLPSTATGTVTSVGSGTGLNGGPITSTGTLALADTAVTPGSYTYMSATVDQQGRITAASNGVTPAIYAPLVNGDLPGPTPIATDDGQFIMTPVS